MATSPMLRLPAELLEHVANQADERDLKALRLACRELHAATDRPFLKAFFTYRTHLVTKYSLDTLVSITASPRLRSQLKSLKFASTDLPYADRPLQNGFRRRVVGRDQTLTPIKMSDPLQLNYETEMEELEAALYQADQVAMKLMVTIMRKLKHANLLPTLGVVYDDMNAVFGCRQVARMAGFEMHSDSMWKLCVGYGSVERTTKLLLEAIADTKLQVRDMRLSNRECTDALIHVMSDPSKAPSLRQSLGSLAYLELDCTDAFTLQPESRDTFLRVLEGFKTLQHLSLLNISGSEESREHFAQIATICSRHEMKSIMLRHCTAAAREIQMLLDPHRPTLESLTLDNVDTFHDEPDSYTLSSLYSTLADDFTLREFTSKELWEMNNGVMEDEVQFEGVEEVREGLERLMKRPVLLEKQNDLLEDTVSSIDSDIDNAIDE